jgi:hypothetical protein
MGWERRHGTKLYFYKSARIAGRPRKVYVGAGPAAQELARLESERRQQREIEGAALAVEQASVAVADELTEELRALASLLVEAALLAAGRRCHRGEWRRPRNGRKGDDREASRTPGTTGKAEGS